MPITDNKNYPFSFSMIDIKNIDPSPYQHRKYFDEDSLRELGVSYVASLIMLCDSGLIPSDSKTKN